MSVQVDLNEWSAETMRLTLFPKGDVEAAGLSWWESVVGEPPEAHNLRPREGRLEESGRIFDGKCNLTLLCEPTRIDWLLSPIITSDREVMDFPSFAKLTEALDLYRDLLLPWLAYAPPAKRIAFGCVLSHPSDQREAEYRWISDLLPAVTLDPKGSTDFNYSINRPRPATSISEGLTINRISKWSVVKLHSIQLRLPHGQVTSANHDLFACRLELDINTVPEFSGEFSAYNFKQIMRELVNLGIEIATQGDVP